MELVSKKDAKRKKKSPGQLSAQAAGESLAGTAGLVGGYTAAHYGARDLGGSKLATAHANREKASGVKFEEMSPHNTYRPATNTFRVTDPKHAHPEKPKAAPAAPAPTKTPGKEVELYRKPTTHASDFDDVKAGRSRGAGGHYGRAAQYFGSAKRLKWQGRTKVGLGIAAAVGGTAALGHSAELQRRSEKETRKRQMTYLKQQRTGFAKYESPRQKNEKRKGHAYTAGGVAGLTGGMVAGYHAQDLAESGVLHQQSGRLHHYAGNAEKAAENISRGNKLVRRGNKVAVGSLVAMGAGVGLAAKGAHHYRQAKPQYEVKGGRLVQKSLVSKADLERRSWAEVSKALVEVQKPGKSGKQRAAEAGGATATVLGGTAYAGSIPIKNRFGALASQSEAAAKEAGGIARKRSKNVNDYVHTVSGGGEPKTGTLPDSPPSSPKHGREWAKNRAHWHGLSAAADRASQAKTAKIGRVGLGVAALGAGGYGYSKVRQSRRKKEFGKALTKEQAEEHKGPQLPKNPLVTGGIGAGALGTGLFAGSRVPYHIQTNQTKKHEGISTEAWRQSKNFHQFGRQAKKDAMKPSGKSTGWDAKRYFQAGNAEKAKAELHSVKSTTARAKAIKTANIGRKGLIAAAGGAAATGIGLAYDKHQKRRASMA